MTGVTKDEECSQIPSEMPSKMSLTLAPFSSISEQQGVTDRPQERKREMEEERQEIEESSDLVRTQKNEEN
ncbi:hypothetical protein P7K49_037807 [Saguinus oedipus]|uniref:Uncharacterized protein n=1 Tax=Saguinus oedipus TaxID=9490 RepID=A0ABQ9TJ68_SAGOE|nr:hypothetical protein P7K49_037807 [Saguinus oedipus]